MLVSHGPFLLEVITLPHVFAGGNNLQVPRNMKPTHILSVDWNDVVNVIFHASLFLQSDPLLIEGQEVFFGDAGQGCILDARLTLTTAFVVVRFP